MNISIFHSLLGALTLGFLGSWWRYSHDVETVIFPQIFSIATFYMTISALKAEDNAKARWAAIFLALAVWAHQINALIVPSLILLISLYKSKRPFKVKMIKLFFIWGFFISLLFSLPHILFTGIPNTLCWLRGAGSMGLWGKGFSPESIRTFGKFLYGSIV